MSLVTWDQEHQLAAQAEGWDIFDTGGSGRNPFDPMAVDHDPFEIQAILAPEDWNGLPYTEPVFDGDVGAWQHVVAHAAAGSPLHQRALRFLALESPGEIVTITEHIVQEGS